MKIISNWHTTCSLRRLFMGNLSRSQPAAKPSA
jgi:hypothetical protein